MAIGHRVLKNENYLPEGFVPVKRVDGSSCDTSALQSIITQHCIDNGQPIVISNMDKIPGWDQELFNLNNMKKFKGNHEIIYTVKSNDTKKTLRLGDFIESLQKNYKLNSKDQFGPEPMEDVVLQSDEGVRRRKKSVKSSTTNNDSYQILNQDLRGVYAKDILCPEEYGSVMDKIVPEYLSPHGTNDLFSLLPPRFKAKNLMCYLAQNNTGTPMHRDLCGTMGHNIMTMSTPGGYAEWYIVVNEDREKLAAILKPRLSAEKELIKSGKSVTKSSFMESERGWLRLTQQKNDLKVQVVLQEVGDLVIIPSRAYHQVRNVGVSIKVAWNRITAKTLNYAFQDQLPLYQIISRPEVFKCKAITHHTVYAWLRALFNYNQASNQNLQDLSVMKYGPERFIEDAKLILDIYLKKVLHPELLPEADGPDILIDDDEEFCIVKCDFCHADIFLRYYNCEECVDYDLCMNCYAAGRSCRHVHTMKMRKSKAILSDFIKMYSSFIFQANKALKQDIFQDESDYLETSRLKEKPNLATICRRIERYRKVKQEDSNILQCTHCKKMYTLLELASSGISLTSIFQRLPCSQGSEEKLDKDVDIFVCKSCTEKCSLCEPLVESNDSKIDYNLVYYAQPSYNENNRGAFFDVGLPKSCEYPDYGEKKSASQKKLSLSKRGKVKKSATENATANGSPLIKKEEGDKDSVSIACKIQKHQSKFEIEKDTTCIKAERCPLERRPLTKPSVEPSRQSTEPPRSSTESLRPSAESSRPSAEFPKQSAESTRQQGSTSTANTIYPKASFEYGMPEIVNALKNQSSKRRLPITPPLPPVKEEERKRPKQTETVEKKDVWKDYVPTLEELHKQHTKAQ